MAAGCGMRRSSVALAGCLSLAAACAPFGGESLPDEGAVAGDAGGVVPGPASSTDAGDGGLDEVGLDVARAIWSFDEGGGSDLLDGSGNYNTGIIGTTTTREPGAKGRALAFSNRTGARPSFPSSPSLAISGNAFTLALWVHLPSAGALATHQVLLAKPWVSASIASPTYQFGLEWDGDGTGDVELHVGRPEGLYPAVRAQVLPERWSHLAFVVDDGAVRVFVDGVVQGTFVTGATLSARPTMVLLGADAVGGSVFTGKLDEVRLYARALDAAAIAKLATP